MRNAIWIYLLSFWACAQAVGGITAIRAGAIVDPDSVTILTNQTILISDDKIVAIGGNVKVPQGAAVIDLSQQTVLPGLIDAHTHLVHAGNRAGEFEMRLNGATYEEVARAGGGIVSSVKALRAAICARSRGRAHSPI